MDTIYDFVAARIRQDFASPGFAAADLGAGAGLMATKLESIGYNVVAVDRTNTDYAAASRHIIVDFDDEDFASTVGIGSFHLVTALEILDSVQNPISFLTNIRRLLLPGGVAVLSVARLDLLPAHLRFVLDHAIESLGFERDSDLKSQIFWEHFSAHFLAFAGMALRDHTLFPQEFLLKRLNPPWMVRHVLVVEPRNPAMDNLIPVV